MNLEHEAAVHFCWFLELQYTTLSHAISSEIGRTIAVWSASLIARTFPACPGPAVINSHRSMNWARN